MISNLNKRLFILLGITFLIIFFWNIWGYGLIDPDEGRYSEIPREMLESGDFITPRLNYVDYFEKPALHYWLTAASFILFGQNEFASRFIPAILGLGGAIFVYYLTLMTTARMRAAVYAAFVLSTSLLWVAISRINIIDMTVTFFFTASLFGYWAAVREETPLNRRWLFLFYSGMALAVLSKGLIGVVLPGGIIFWHIVLTKRKIFFAMLRYILFMPGIALFFLIVVPWFWAVCRANPDFFDFFFIHEQFLRYATKIHDRYEPAWFFIPIIIAALTPWIGLMPDIVRTCMGRNGKKFLNDDFATFLALWFAVPFLFFSLSSSKLIPYILPCLPPLSVLGGVVLDSIAEGKDDSIAISRRFIISSAFTLLPIALAGFIYPFFDKKMGANVLLPYTAPVGIALAVFWICSFLFYRRRTLSVRIPVLCFLAFISIMLFTRGMELAETRNSCKEAAGLIKAETQPDDIIVGYGQPMQGLFFYLERRIVLADTLGELAFGAKKEKDPQWFIDSKRLKNLWNGSRRVLLLAPKKSIPAFISGIGRQPVCLGETSAFSLFSNF